MRADQLAALDALAEKLADVFLEEGDPDNWEGNGVPMKEWTNEIRGNRYWAKKNAMSTGGVLTYVGNIKASAIERSANKNPETTAERESDLDRQIGNAQRRADEALKRVLGGAVAATVRK